MPSIGRPVKNPTDFLSFRHQETLLAGLNLLLLALLFLAQLFWPRYLGSPHLPVLFILSLGMAANLGELLWIRLVEDLKERSVVVLTWTTNAFNITIAFGVALYSYKQDVQYFALMIPPILRAAFRLSLGATLLTVAMSDALIFFWVWNYFRVHPPADPSVYIEAGTIALICAVMGLMVEMLAGVLRNKQSALSDSLAQLQKTETRLRVEERLAAVGRLSSAIAHEIRNPVAMISSALATAANRAPGTADNQEMYEIATKEAARLERLTTDFLVYARPGLPAKTMSDLAETIGYIGEICRPRAAENGVEVRCESEPNLWAEVDGGQLQQALLNLAMNALDASLPGSIVTLRGSIDGDWIRIEVENANGPIPPETVACIFEPFFTTKQSGTGLGLAISRKIAVAHGGDIVLIRNDAKLIRFVLTLPRTLPREERAS
jgi:signal transduction histidine kinase